MISLFVGNLPFDATDGELREVFEPFGPLTSVKLISDRETGKPRGFAFVEFQNREDGQKAIAELHGKEFQTAKGSRALTVNEARPRERSGGQGSRGGYGGGSNRDYSR